MGIEYGNKTKLEEIFYDLLKGDALTSLEAVDRYLTTRLSAFIYTIKRKYNVPVESIWATSRCVDGEIIRYVIYRIPPSRLSEVRKRYSG